MRMENILLSLNYLKQCKNYVNNIMNLTMEIYIGMVYKSVALKYILIVYLGVHKLIYSTAYVTFPLLFIILITITYNFKENTPLLFSTS